MLEPIWLATRSRSRRVFEGPLESQAHLAFERIEHVRRMARPCDKPLSCIFVVCVGRMYVLGVSLLEPADGRDDGPDERGPHHEGHVSVLYERRGIAKPLALLSRWAMAALDNDATCYRRGLAGGVIDGPLRRGDDPVDIRVVQRPFDVDAE